MDHMDGVYEPMQSRAEEKKRRLLDAGLQLFGARGFHATTSKDIAQAAGVSVGSFYRYFRDKKTLLLAICARQENSIMGRIIADCRARLDSGCTPAEFVETFVRRGLDTHREQRAFHREIIALQLLDPDVARLGEERARRIRASIREMLAELDPPLRRGDLEARAELIHLVIEEAAHHAIINDSVCGEERLTNELVDMLQRYLLPETVPDATRQSGEAQ